MPRVAPRCPGPGQNSGKKILAQLASVEAQVAGVEVGLAKVAGVEAQLAQVVGVEAELAPQVAPLAQVAGVGCRFSDSPP